MSLMNTVLQLMASQVMHTPVVTADPEETLDELSERLQEQRISGMPVVENGVMIGVVTQSDLARIPYLLDAQAGYVYAELMESGPKVEDQDRNNDGVPDNLESFRDQLKTMKVRNAMRSQVITCAPESTIQEVIRHMTASNVHRIIVSRDEAPVGVISSLDILHLFADSHEST